MKRWITIEKRKEMADIARRWMLTGRGTRKRRTASTSKNDMNKTIAALTVVEVVTTVTVVAKYTFGNL